MQNTCKVKEIEIGWHPEGYRIDKTTLPLNRYTRWTITHDGQWINPKPVCFSSLPPDGWLKVDTFNWN